MRKINEKGSIKKLNDNRNKPYLLYSPIFIDEKTGKVKNKFIKSFSTLEEAEMYRIAYFSNRTDLLKGYNENENSLTFKEVYNLWIKRKEVKNTTLSNYRTYFNISSKLHNIPIRNINFIFLEDMLREFNLSKGTLRNIKYFWRSIWKFGERNHYVENIYIEQLTYPREEKGKKTSKRNRVITEYELIKLWNNLYRDKKNIIDMVLILCYTGLRISELLNLKIIDVNLKDNYINVEKSKTSAGVRKVVIADKIKPLLERRIKERLKSDDKLLNLNTNLFTAIDKRIYKYDSFDNHFRMLFRDLELSYHTIHDTRHTFVTMLSNTEANQETIIKMVGHSNYKITSETYIHKNIEEMKKVVNLI